MPDLGKLSSRLARAFTFPEVLVLVGVMGLMAGLATQLLLSGHGFTARVETQQKFLQSALRMRLELEQWTQDVRPAPWANPSQTFVREGGSLKIYETPGDPHSRAWTLAVDNGSLVAQAGDVKTTWGPLDGLALAWWTKDDRVLGVKVSWAGGGEKYDWLFAWGSRPL